MRKQKRACYRRATGETKTGATTRRILIVKSSKKKIERRRANEEREGQSLQRQPEKFEE